MGEMKLIDISLKLADRTINYSMDVIEDVQVRIQEFNFLYL